MKVKEPGSDMAVHVRLTDGPSVLEDALYVFKRNDKGLCPFTDVQYPLMADTAYSTVPNQTPVLFTLHGNHGNDLFVSHSQRDSTTVKNLVLQRV